LVEFDYRLVLDAFVDAVVAADRENRVVYANAAVEKLLGWRPVDLVGERLTVLMPERMRPLHENGFERYLKTGAPRLIGRAIRVPALRRDGSEVEIELTLSAHRAASADEIFVGSLRDLSDRVELERQLTVTRYMRAATRAAPKLTAHLDLAHVLDTAVDTIVADFDAALARVWILEPGTSTLRLRASAGLSREVEKSSRARIDVATHPYKVGVVARTLKPFIANSLAGDPQFDQAWVERERIRAVAVFPLLVGQNLVGVLIGFFRHQLFDEVFEVLGTFSAILSAAVNDARLFAQTQEAVRARDVFLSIASHELRTPLTPILHQLQSIASLNTLSGEPIAGSVMEKIEKTERQVVHLKQLIDNLLDVSRLTEKRLRLSLETVELGSLVAEVVERVLPGIEKAGSRLSIEAPGAVVGRWDRLRLEEIVANLLDNAVKYGQGKPIEVEVAREGDHARLRVRDHGIGISAEDQERIFGRFERAVSDTSYGGFGLGLWISRLIAEAMQGSLGVESQPGEGATFTVLLPVNVVALRASA
jgi:PAS domain S-box-containing protein